MDIPQTPSKPGGQPLRLSAGSLVEAAIAGDTAALESLWQTNRRWVAAVVMAHKPHRADLDDLLQDVAMTLMAKISQIQEPAAFHPWLRMVAMNVARLAGRKHAAAPRSTSLDAPSAGNDATLGERTPGRSQSLAVPEEARRLMDLALDLHEDYREPLLLRAINELSYQQIGAILGLPETTIETRIARGRRMLRERAQAAGIAGESAARTTG